MTYTALTAGLRALRPCIAADSPDLGECAPFAVSRDGSGIFHTSKQGTIVKLRVAVRPVAELAFRTLIDAEDRLSLPLPYGGLVKATWLHERKVGLRIFDVPEGMLPSSLKLGLEEAHETVLSCDWDVDSRTGLPQSQVVYATLLSTNPPTAIKFRSGLVMKCHIIVLDTPVLAPTLHRPELDGILSGEAVASLRPPATSYAGAAAGRALAPPPAPPAGPARAPQAPPLPSPPLPPPPPVQETGATPAATLEPAVPPEVAAAAQPPVAAVAVVAGATEPAVAVVAAGAEPASAMVIAGAAEPAAAAAVDAAAEPAAAVAVAGAAASTAAAAVAEAAEPIVVAAVAEALVAVAPVAVAAEPAAAAVAEAAAPTVAAVAEAADAAPAADAAAVALESEEPAGGAWTLVVSPRKSRRLLGRPPEPRHSTARRPLGATRHNASPTQC